MNVLTGILIIAGLIAWYRYSIWRHPYRRCTHCGGRGTHSDPAFRGAYGNCHYCKDQRLIRFGVRIFTPSVYRDIQAGKRGRNY